MSITLWIVVIVAVIAIAIWWMSRGASAINDYFVSAVTVYARRGDGAARMAAVTAATVAAGKQRASMLVLLHGMAKDVLQLPDGERTKARLLELAHQIDVQGSDLQSINDCKQRLGQLSPDLLTALDKFDASVFRKKWPDLF